LKNFNQTKKTTQMKMQKNGIIRKSIVKCGLGIGALLLFANCNKAGLPGIGCTDGSWIKEWTAAQEALSTTSQAYGTERNVETCTNYKNAINDYLDVYEDIKSCLPVGTRSGLDESIKESRAEAAEIDCTED